MSTKEIIKKAFVLDFDLYFDNHEDDRSGLLKTEDYTFMGRLMKEPPKRNRGGFGILEGDYNHEVLGKNVLAFVEGLKGK